MVIGVARVVIHIPGSQSLKDKRQVVRSVLARAQRELHIAAAEVEEQDRWQVAVLGLTCVSTEAGHVDAMLSKAVSFIGRNLSDGDIVDYQTEVLHAL